MAYIRKLESGLYQATIRLPDGRRRTRTDPLKGVVRTWAQDSEAAMRRGEWADPKDGRITVTEWWGEWRQTKVLELATARKYESHWRAHVEPRWGRVKLGAITAWDVEGWLADMQRAKVGATTQYQSFQLLRTMLADATRHKRIASDPTGTVKVKTPPKHVDRFLTREEYERLIVEFEGRDKVMVALMAMAGLRWSEAAGLHAHRIDLGRAELTVVEVLQRDGTYKRPKTKAGQRVVPLVPDLLAMLAEFIGDGPLFPGVDYTNWRRRVFVPAVLRVGLDDPQPTAHDCRHSFGSWLAEAGVSATDIGKLMGHGSLRATERYLHAGDGRFARALSALARPQAVGRQ